MKLYLVQEGGEESPGLPGTSPGSRWVGCSYSYWPRPRIGNNGTDYEQQGSKNESIVL